MSKLQQTRYDELLRRVGGIIGPGSKVAEALGELFPVISVEDPPPELWALSKHKLMHGSDAVTGGVGQNGGVQLFNPADSNNVLVITSMSVSSATSQRYNLQVRFGAMATFDGDGRIRDSRFANAVLSVGELRSDVNATLPTPAYVIRANAGESMFLRDPNGIAVLFPGTGFDCVSNTLNSNFQCSWFWRERVLEPSEFLPG